MATISIRIDDTLKQQSEQVFDAIGLNMTTAITAFLKQAVRVGGIPFDLRVPNAETLAALEEVRDMKAHPERYPGYTDAGKLMEDLLA